MPELPEVETVRRTLRPLLQGRMLSGFDLYWDRTLVDMTAGEFARHVAGSTILDVNRRGKLVILELNREVRISVHLRMTGELLVVTRDGTVDSSRERHLRASFALDDGSTLLFYDIRKFGRIAYLTPQQYERLNADLGVEPLSAEFTDDVLTRILQTRARSIKPLLLDQTVVAGLGNIYVDEALFASRIHPLTKANMIADHQARTLRHAIVEILASSVDRHGTTLRNYRSGTGEQGENQAHLRIYGLKRGEPCATCSTPVERLVVGQRATVFCPSCQPVPPYAMSIAAPTSASSGSRIG